MTTYGMHDRQHISSVLARGEEAIDSEIVIGGWVKTGRPAEKKTLFFFEVNDGSTPQNVQCKRKLAEGEDNTDWVRMTKTGSCLLLRCKVMKAPEKAKQSIELDIVDVLHFGPVEKDYAIAKTKLSLEYLRSPAAVHLRCRTNTIASVARVRNALAQATHKFFSDNGFLYLHTPLITASDCEGAGEMFQVTTLLAHADELAKTPKPTEEDLQAAKTAVESQGDVVRQAKDEKKDKKSIKKEVAKLMEAKSQLDALEERMRIQGGIPHKEDGTIDYSKDFFSRAANLTVSGQLQGEAYACGMSNIYTFGPTFRAENSNTTRHLAEFWMIEPEIAFCDITGLMQCTEDYVRFCAQYVLDHCEDDLAFFTKHFDDTTMDRVKLVASEEYVRIEYKDAVKMLMEHNDKFEFPVADRIDLASEHERYLTEQIFKKPVIVYNYPKEIKSFYMRQNFDDYDTVAAMDMLVPGVGELVGGSQREERTDVLVKRIEELGLVVDDYDWYLDLRRHGTTVHAGFGLGFERLILFMTGMENIRDVIPFPRYPGHIL
eukprot:m.27540 g.27540  ORF g.27540 m.27540 type:complete len:544 (+) comp5952_c0_seq1:109-1740(+)